MSTTLKLINEEIDILSTHPDSLVEDWSHLIELGDFCDWEGNPEHGYQLTQEAEDRLMFLSMLVDQYEEGQLDYDGLVLMYNLGGESLTETPPFSGMFTTGDSGLDKILNNL